MYIGIKLDGRIFHRDGDKFFLDDVDVTEDPEIKIMVDHMEGIIKWAGDNLGLKLDKPDPQILEVNL